MNSVPLSTLTSIGLSAEEADIYQSLLSHGPQGASQLAKTTSVKRTYVYAVCTSLISKGLTTKLQKGHNTTFTALNPTQLQSLAQEHSLQASQALFGLENLLPQLISQYTSASSKPVITYHEGVEGVKKVYQDTLTAPGTLYALVQTSTVDPAIYDWVTKTYVKDRISHHINVQAIVASGSKTKIYTALDQKELRQTKVVDSTLFPFQLEINIYGDKVAFINHRTGTQLLGIIINHPLIATTLRSWFHLVWPLLP